ncbi:MAG: L-threonylcarbamoyladenylate synthase [Nitrososphaerales archaeon]
MWLPLAASKVVKCFREAIEEAAKIISDGGVVVYPTDTVYGLGCDPFNVKAVERVFLLKKRSDKPMPILVSGLEVAEKLVNLGGVGRMLASKFWPGALTIVSPLKKDVSLPEALTCGSKTLGVRVPRHSCALNLLNSVKGAMVGTSANRSGDAAPLTIEDAIKSLGFGADLYLDAGKATLGKESTVVEVCGEEVKFLREGAIRREAVLEALREFRRL